MEQPLVSIIIPIYNAENTLRKCLGRVRNQTYENIEVLLVDDGSTDHSGEICQEYCAADPRFRLLRQAHQGVAAGRNRAMAEAKGTYLQFCDSDDWMTRDATARLVGAAVRSGSELITAGFYRVSGRRVYEHSSIGISGIMTRDEFVEHMMRAPGNFYYGVLWNKLYKRSLIRRRMLQCPEDLSWCEDTLFNYTYLQYVSTVTVLDQAVYFYRKTKGSLSSSGITLSRTIKTRSRLYENYKVLTAPVRKSPLQMAPFWVLPALDGGPVLKRIVKDPHKIRIKQREGKRPWIRETSTPVKF